MAQDCIFCKIGAGEIESEIVYRDDTCFVIRDIAPKAPAHLLVIPNRHFTRLDDLTPADYAMVGGMFAAASEVAGAEGVRGGHVVAYAFGLHARAHLPGDQGLDTRDVKIPDESAVQRAQHILDELRRRSSQRFRPRFELDYINRLLQRF